MLQKQWQSRWGFGLTAQLLPRARPSPVWEVGTLVHAVAEALAVRFNPLSVRGELSGFSRAASGHCYFSLKDADGQLRCAMFRRAANALSFSPKDGDQVELLGKLDVYGPRGDLQLIVEDMEQAGQGNLFEQFIKLKNRLESEGLFDASRKRPLPPMPRSIGVVTSLGAAALRDVVTTLTRRVPHIPVTIYPASVQGAGAPAELCAAVHAASAGYAATGHPQVLLLVRGGGSLEDLWAFNAESLARALVSAPMPVISGVGHETDFTIADFVADLRAPTPTAAAELCATERSVAVGVMEWYHDRLRGAARTRLDTQAQRLDRLAQRFARPSALVAKEHRRLVERGFDVRQHVNTLMEQKVHVQKALEANLDICFSRQLERERRRLERCEAALKALDPKLVLQRGYAWLVEQQGKPVTSVGQTRSGQRLRAVLADGEVELRVT